ncbi:hypothetical protein AB3329_00910 [Streptococcus sp. H31]|uniref:hypothetical protein n=1 Tax=Streptococcus huangxiaojuni TaxID=3237239 RepID=UPI0034A24F82
MMTYSIKFNDSALMVYLNSKIYKIQNENILNVLKGTDIQQNKWLKIELKSANLVLQSIYNQLSSNIKDKNKIKTLIHYAGNDEETVGILEQVPDVKLVSENEQYLCKIIDEVDYQKSAVQNNSDFLIVVSKSASFVLLGDEKINIPPSVNEKMSSKFVLLARAINVINNLLNIYSIMTFGNMMIANYSNLTQLQEKHYHLSLKNEFIKIKEPFNFYTNVNKNEAYDNLFKMAKKYFNLMIEVNFGKLKQIPFNILESRFGNNLEYAVAETPFDAAVKAYQKALVGTLVNSGIKGDLCDLSDKDSLNNTQCKLLYNLMESEKYPIVKKLLSLSDIKKYNLNNVEYTIVSKFLGRKHKFAIVVSQIQNFNIIKAEIIKNDILAFELFGFDFQHILTESYRYIIASSIQNSCSDSNKTKKINTENTEVLSVEEYLSLFKTNKFNTELKNIMAYLKKTFSYYKWNDEGILENTGITIGKVELEEEY